MDQVRVRDNAVLNCSFSATRQMKPSAAMTCWLSVLAAGLIWAGQDSAYVLDPVVVTASRVPTVFSKSTRCVVVISKEDIQAAPVHSLHDVLALVPGLDLRRRGPMGIQADLGVRGSTFEQTLVLVNGIKVSDPQTGHHNLDLPFGLQDIERIEVLKGHGSRLHGPNAFGGVVNVITQEGETRAARFQAGGGEFGFSNLMGSASYTTPNTRQHVSIAGQRSDGFRSNTDFDAATAFLSTSFSVGKQCNSVSAAWGDKAFGANGFYSSNYPGQWEHTQTQFVSARSSRTQGPVKLNGKASWRTHLDDFVLDRERPAWYRNQHEANTVLAEMEACVAWLGKTSIGTQVASDHLESSNLGERSRTWSGLFVEHLAEVGQRLLLQPGCFAFHQELQGWELNPGLDVGFRVWEGIRIYGTAGRSFRIPTFTELYYTSPANLGNPDLEPEHAWHVEGGLRWFHRLSLFEASCFLRQGEDVIDWVRNLPDEPWQAFNVSTLTTWGMEVRQDWRFQDTRIGIFLPKAGFGYAFLSSQQSLEPLESKYALDHYRHQGLGRCNFAWPFGIYQTLIAKHERRLNGKHYTLLDTGIYKHFWKARLFLGATNLLNQEYSEVGGVPMPGRWIKAGMSLALDS